MYKVCFRYQRLGTTAKQSLGSQGRCRGAESTGTGEARPAIPRTGRTKGLEADRAGGQAWPHQTKARFRCTQALRLLCESKLFIYNGPSNRRRSHCSRQGRSSADPSGVDARDGQVYPSSAKHAAKTGRCGSQPVLGEQECLAIELVPRRASDGSENPSAAIKGDRGETRQSYHSRRVQGQRPDRPIGVTSTSHNCGAIAVALGHSRAAGLARSSTQISRTQI